MVTETQGIIHDHFTVVNRLALVPLRPIFGAPDYIRRMRRRHYLRDIEAILNWDEEKKMKFLDILTDIVSVSYFSTEDYIHWYNRIEKVLDELEGFEELKRLRSYFESIDYNQRKKILQIALDRLHGDIETITRWLYRYAQESKDDREKLKEIIILTSILRLISDLVEDEVSEEKLKAVIVLMLRFIAYLLRKINLNELMMDLICYSKLTPVTRLTEEEYERIYEELLSNV